MWELRLIMKRLDGKGGGFSFVFPLRAAEGLPAVRRKHTI